MPEQRVTCVFTFKSGAGSLSAATACDYWAILLDQCPSHPPQGEDEGLFVVALRLTCYYVYGINQLTSWGRPIM